MFSSTIRIDLFRACGSGSFRGMRTPARALFSWRFFFGNATVALSLLFGN